MQRPGTTCCGIRSWALAQKTPGMRLLLTNDDGIDPDGLHALPAAPRAFGEPVLVAPAGPQSGCSHTTSSSIRIEPRGDGRFAVHGTPADCTRIGLLKLV